MLLVHGIGRQAEGDTLTAWGDALVTWLSGWLGHDQVQSGPARLRSRGDAPAWLDVDVALPGGAHGDGRTARWRLAEGWWAEAFTTPAFGDLALWSFAVLPWTLVAHMVTRFHAAWRPRPSSRQATLPVLAWLHRPVAIATASLRLLLAVLVAPLLAVAVLLIVALGALPITTLRRAAGALQRGLAVTIGDSFVLLASPTKARAIVHGVEERLQWLSRECGRVVVVAHSQGAVVAHRAIEGARPDNLDRLVTFGSGQAKLADLEALRHSGAHRLVWAAPAGLVAMGLAAWKTIEGVRVGTDDPWIAGTILGLTGAGALVVALRAAAHANRLGTDVSVLGAEKGWLDLYASHDPVPNGPLFTTDVACATSRRILNRASVLRDHSSYWTNSEEFVATIAAVAAAAGGQVTAPPGTTAGLVAAIAPARRRWRIRWLRAARVLVVALASYSLWRDWDRLDLVGARALSVAVRVLDLLPFAPVGSATIRAAATDQWVGVASVGAAAVLGYAVLLAIWTWWDRDDTRRFLARGRYRFLEPAFVTLLYAGCTLVVLVLTIPAWSPRAPTLDAVYDLLVLAAVAGIAVSLTWLPVNLVFQPLVWLGALRAPRPPTPRQLAAFLAPLIGAALFTGHLYPAAIDTVALVAIALLGVATGVALPALMASSARVRRVLAPTHRAAQAGHPAVVAARLEPRPTQLGTALEAAFRDALEAALAAPPDAEAADTTQAIDAARAHETAAADAVALAEALAALGRCGAARDGLVQLAPRRLEAALLLARLDPGDDAAAALRRHADHGPVLHRRRARRELAGLLDAQPSRRLAPVA